MATRYERAARKEVVRRLASRTMPVMLFTVACYAEQGSRGAGKKNDLYHSLYDYADLLPSGWHTGWLKVQGRDSDSLLYAIPPGWTSGPSDSLLLGGGTLVKTNAPLD